MIFLILVLIFEKEFLTLKQLEKYQDISPRNLN